MLSVDENGLSSGVARTRNLSRDAQRVRKLRLAASELPERFCDGHGLDTAADQSTKNTKHVFFYIPEYFS